MNPPTDESKNAIRITTLAWIVASVVAGIACVVLCSGRVLPVFANDRLMLVHILAAIPFGYFLVSRSSHLLMRFKFCVVIICVIAILIFASLSFTSDVLAMSGAGYGARWFTRSCVAVYFTFAWLALAPIAISWDAKTNWIWTVVVWLALPCVYGLKQFELASEEFSSANSSLRLVKASLALERLKEISGQTIVQGKSTAQWDRSLRRQIAETESLIEKPLPAGIALPNQLQRAMLLLSLSRTFEATNLLDGLKSTDSQVRLLQAIAARESQDWKRVEVICRELVATQLTTASHDPSVYHLLGESLMKLRKTKEAVQCFQAGIAACPYASGDFKMRIGALLGDAGNHAGAVEQYMQAQEIDTTLKPEALRRIAAMRNHSCQL